MNGAAMTFLASLTAGAALGVTLPSPAQAGAVTVNPVQSTTYILNQNGNPITFGAGAKIQTNPAERFAVYGNNAASWNVTNQGIIRNTYSGTGYINHFGSGIYLKSSSTVTNSGTITATGNYGFGIYSKSSSTVTNSGTITAAANSGVGVSLFRGGMVTNTAGGRIAGGNFGVELGNGATVTNIGGTINGESAVGVFGGTVTNIGGTIAGAGQYNGGVFGVGGITTVTNTGGTITGAAFGVGLYGGKDSVTNTGTISATAAYGYGVKLGGRQSSVTNSGMISAAGVYGTGVKLALGGAVTNQTTGTISGSGGGVYVYGGSGAVTNSGAIKSTGLGGGVWLQNGGTVNNSGTISAGSVNTAIPATRPAYFGGYGVGGNGITVTNSGAIFSFLSGVSLQNGGSLTNTSSGNITGEAVGVLSTTSTATVVNAGSIIENNAIAIPAWLLSNPYVRPSTLGSGVWLGNGGAVNNTGSIAGAVLGVYIYGSAGAVTNAGAISGSTASVEFAGPGANTLTLQTGSVLTGPAIGSTAIGATNALVLQGTGAANNNFLNFNTLNVQAGGLWVLNGVSAIPQTTVVSGNLQIGDLLHPSAQLTGAVTIDAGATLSGHSHIVGNVTNNGGTVSPGGTIGTLTINGNYTQAPGSTLSIEVNPQASSTLVVAGTATLGGTLSFVGDSGIYRVGTKYTFLTAGSVAGAFSTITFSNNLPFTVTGSGATEVLTLAAGTLTSDVAASATSNQISAGTAFVNVPVGHADFDSVANVLTNLPTTAQELAAFDKLGGEVAADTARLGRDETRSFVSAVSDQLFDESQGGGVRDAWGRAFGAAGAVSGDGNAHGTSSSGGGSVLGGGMPLGPDSAVGATFGYDRTNISLQGLSQSGSRNAYSFGFYGEHRMGPWFVDAAAMIGLVDGDTRRTIAVASIARVANGSFDGTSTAEMVSTGLRWRAPQGFLIEPSVSLIASQASQSGYTETGAGDIDLVVSGKNDSATEVVLGTRFAEPIALGNGTSVTIEGRAAWLAGLGASAPTIQESFSAAPTNSFTLTGADPGSSSVVIGAGVSCDLSKQLSPYGRYDGTFGDAVNNKQLTVGIRFAW